MKIHPDLKAYQKDLFFSFRHQEQLVLASPYLFTQGCQLCYRLDITATARPFYLEQPQSCQETQKWQEHFTAQFVDNAALGLGKQGSDLCRHLCVQIEMLSCWVVGVVLAGYSPVSDTSSLTVKSQQKYTNLWTKGKVEVGIIATWSFKENMSSAHMAFHLP